MVLINILGWLIKLSPFICSVKVWKLCSKWLLQIYHPFLRDCLSFFHQLISVVNAKPLSDLRTANIFFQFVAWFFTLLMLCFDQRTLILMKHSLSVFLVYTASIFSVHSLYRNIIVYGIKILYSKILMNSVGFLILIHFILSVYNRFSTSERDWLPHITE